MILQDCWMYKQTRSSILAQGNIPNAEYHNALSWHHHLCHVAQCQILNRPCSESAKLPGNRENNSISRLSIHPAIMNFQTHLLITHWTLQNPESRDLEWKQVIPNLKGMRSRRREDYGRVEHSSLWAGWVVRGGIWMDSVPYF